MTINLRHPVLDQFFFGREQETEYLSKLLAGFERSDTSLLLVEGPAGIGKTSLIRQVLQNQNRKNSFVLYGKYSDQPGQVPYQAWKEAIGDWMNQMLVLSEDELKTLRENATAALQHNMGTVTAVFEELEQFFGKKLFKTPSVKAESHQIKSRFYYFFGKFLKSISRSGYQIVLFLDDLQWADPASQLLTEELVLRNAVPGLIIIGAQRTGIAGSIPKTKQLLKEHPGRVFSYRLNPVGQVHLHHFIPPHWDFMPADTAAFNQYLWFESEGNPLKAKELIKAIDNSLSVSRHSLQNEVLWENLPHFDRSKSSEHFMLKQLAALPQQQKKLLSAASCAGYHFEVKLLKKVSDFSPELVEQLLSKLENNELLIRKESAYIFVHDVVFSAANSLMTGEEKILLHQKIGKTILDGLQNYEQDDFFKAVNHLNTGYEPQADSGELVLLNIHAARQAIKKSAFEKAWQYFSFAEELLKQLQVEKVVIVDQKLAAVWRKEGTGKNNLQYQVLFGFAETNFLMLQFDRALFYSNEVLKLKISRHQKVLATLIKIRICSALVYKSDVQQILQDGMESLESVLKDFDIVFPTDPDELLRQADANSAEISRLAAGLNEETDFAAKINPDQEYQDLMKLVMNSMTFVYYMDVRKNLYMGIQFLLLNFTKGFTPMTPVLFSVSFISASISPLYQPMAFLLGKISLRMIEIPAFSNYSYIVYYIATLNFFAWENHYKTCIKKLKLAVVQAKEAGDHHYASFCATNILVLKTYRGQNLAKHLLYTEKLARQNQHVFFISSCDTQFSAYLTGAKGGFLESHFVFSEDLIRDAEKNFSGRFHLNLSLQQLYYLSGNLEKALEAGKECERLENVYRGFQIKLEHYFFYSLILLQRAVQNAELLHKTLDEVRPKLEEFRRLQTFGSGNYRHKMLLIEAEIARCQGDFETTTLLYDQSISEAKKQKFIHHAAIASELAGNYYLSKNRKRLARIYLKEAFQLYRKWGADAKLEWLKQKHAFLRKDDQPDPSLAASGYRSVHELIQITALPRGLKLAEAGKILLTHLMNQSHASAGAILAVQDKSWRIRIFQRTNREKDFEEIENELPEKIINYAINKGEKLLLTDLQKMPLFAGDPYLARFNPVSVFCYPVSYGTKTEALIYLENLNPNIEKDEWFLLLIEHVAAALANVLHDENLKRLNRELQVQEQQKIEAVIASQEKERQRIAEELHDSVGQMLSLVKLNLSQINAENESGSLLQQTSQQLDESIGELRSISHNLMPPDLQTKTLTEILEKLLDKSRNSDAMEYQLGVFGVSDNLPEAVKFTLYRIVQEILHNISKHASAKKVAINITRTDDGINLIVEDDGVGFDTALVHTGIGLKNIYSRVKLLDGYFDVDSSLNRGTIYNITIPLNQ